MDESIEIRKQVVAMLMQGGDYSHNAKSLIMDAQEIVKYIENGQTKMDVIGKPKFTREQVIESHEKLKTARLASS